jgi:hypothetical protein
VKIALHFEWEFLSELQYRKVETKNKMKIYEHGNVGTDRGKSEKGMIWRAAMREFFKLGDFHPKTGQTLLPPVSKKDIYEELKIDLLYLNKPIIHLSYFNMIWRVEFSTVIIPPQLRLGKCTDCVNNRALLMAEKDPVQRIDLKAKRSLHFAHVSKQKNSYYDRRFLAVKNPEKVLSIIVDGMDQNKLAIPQFMEVSKDEDINEKIKVKLIGVLCHGRNPQARGYFLDPRFSGDSNATCEVLRRVLKILVGINFHLRCLYN